MSESPDTEAIAARAEAATPGEWHIDTRQDRQLIIRTTDADVCQVFTDDLNSNPSEDAEFIATAKSDVATLLAALATAEKERETATNVAKRANAALDATCRREEAERAVLQSCKQALDLYFVWATSGPDKDQEYIDGVLSAQLGQVDEMLANYHKATGPSDD